MRSVVTGWIILVGLSSCLTAGSFSRDDTKEVVIDSAANLMWQDDSDAKTVTKTWEDAIDYCETLTLGGFDDWHLPNRNELKSIVDYSRVNPAIDPTFRNVVSTGYWSSTTVAGHASAAWLVRFNGGGDYWGAKTDMWYVRCVRDN